MQGLVHFLDGDRNVLTHVQTAPLLPPSKQPRECKVNDEMDCAMLDTWSVI